MIDNPCDHAEEIREMKRMIRELATHSGLANSSITSGPGLSVATPEGVRYKPGSSQSMEPASGGKPAASIKFGTAGKLEQSGDKIVSTGKFEASEVGAGGSKIGSDGRITNDANDLKIGSNTDFAGNVKIGGTAEAVNVKATGNLYTPWRGGSQSVESLAEDIQANALAGQSAAAAAQSTANGRATVASVTTAQNRADSAYSLANTAKNRADDAYAEATGSGPGGRRVTYSEYQSLLSAHNALRSYVYSIHGTPSG